MANSTSSTIYVVGKYSNQSVVNSEVLVDDTQLKDSLLTPNKRYWFKFMLLCTIDNALSGFKFGLKTPVGATGNFVGQLINTTSGVFTLSFSQGLAGIATSIVGIGDYYCELEGHMDVGGVGGVFGLQFAQNVALGGSIVVKDGSVLIYSEQD